MAFVSFTFIAFIFVTILIYFLFPQKHRWCVLLAAGFFFYWMNSHWLILVMLGTALITWFFGIRIEQINETGKKEISEKQDQLSIAEKKAMKQKVKNHAKNVLVLGIIIIVAILVFLKYYDFFVKEANHFFAKDGEELSLPHLLVPLGISFYSLQAIAYLTDIFRGKIKADRNPLKFALFMSYFPQIVQGPIPRYAELAGQLYEGHSFSYSRLCEGLQLMIWGFYQKMVIADRLAPAVGKIFSNYKEHQGLFILFGSILYGLQIYCDFAGGIDIARGFSQIIGIDLVKNFEQPYFSCSIEEFWRRWHITLGSWMRDYIFYPLSLSGAFGNLSRKTRKLLGNFIGKRLPSLLAMFIVYILVGWWHGSDPKYIVYGLWNGFFILAGILLPEVYAKMRNVCQIDESTLTWKIFKMLRTYILVSLGRVFVCAPSLRDGISMQKRILKGWKQFNWLLDGSLSSLGISDPEWNLLIVSVLILLAVDYLHEKHYEIRKGIARQHIVFRWLIYIAAIIAVLVFGIWGPEYDPSSFIYGAF